MMLAWSFVVWFFYVGFDKFLCSLGMDDVGTAQELRIKNKKTEIAGLQDLVSFIGVMQM